MGGDNEISFHKTNWWNLNPQFILYICSGIWIQNAEARTQGALICIKHIVTPASVTLDWQHKSPLPTISNKSMKRQRHWGPAIYLTIATHHHLFPTKHHICGPLQAVETDKGSTQTLLAQLSPSAQSWSVGQCPGELQLEVGWAHMKRAPLTNF